jgi:hypothetical protein
MIAVDEQGSLAKARENPRAAKGYCDVQVARPVKKFNAAFSMF